jgi:Tol biopolymer transport system component
VTFWVCCEVFDQVAQRHPNEPPAPTAVVFLHDSVTNTTKLISDAEEGGEPAGRLAISADGRYVAYACCSASFGNEVKSYNRVTGITILIGFGTKNDPNNVAISDDGRFVAFAARAAKLSSNTGTNDVYLWDRTTRVTTLASVHRNGAPADHGSNYPTVNSDGTRIAFQSTATNLVSGDTNRSSDVFVRGTP